MPKFVVLLRGVNVGKANRVPMADFRKLLEVLGFGQVQTLLNSGNAVFSAAGRSAAKHAETIAKAITQQFGFTVAVVVKSEMEFDAALRNNPAVPAEAEYSRFLVAFSQQPGGLQTLEAIKPLVHAPEFFHVGEFAAYLLCSPGILESKAAAAMVGKAGRGVTTRNWATALKLRALLSAQPGGC
jgi:uncharacterized protein (DUF1697 family)